MKNMLLTFLLIPLISFSQAKIDSVEGTIYLREVREIGLTSKKLKDKAFDWIAKAYNNSNYVVRVNEDDRIIAKGSFDVNSTYEKGKYAIPHSLNIDYTLDLEFKDGRYKIEVNQMPKIHEMVWLHLLSWNDYKTYRLRLAENHDGPGKRAVMKIANDDEKLMEEYTAQKDLSSSMVNQSLEYVSNLEKSLHDFMKIDQEDDW